MVLQPKANPVRAFAVKHGEKVALGASVLALSIFLVGRLAAKEDPNLEKLDVALEKADAALKNPKPGHLPPREKAWETAALGPWNTISVAQGADNWAASLYSELRPREVEPPKTAPLTLLVPTVELGKVQAQLDGVALEWSVREAEPVKGAVKVDVAAFKLERETNGRWEPLATLDAKARSYRDAATEPRTAYRYRVTATSARPDVPVIATLATEPLKTPGIWRLEYLNPVEGKVWVTISKYERSLGKTVSVRHIHEAGEAIGWWTEPGAPAPTSKHRVQVGTNSVVVDFDTGAKLVSVAPKSVHVLNLRCDTRFDPKTGLRLGCDLVVEKAPHSLMELVVEGPDGREVLRMPDPRAQDLRCPAHAGK